MRLHVEALYTRNPDGRLLAVNDPGAAPAPKFFLGRTTDGNAWWARHDLDAGTLGDLAKFAQSLPRGLPSGPDSDCAASVIARLERMQPVTATWAGPAFAFPSEGETSDGMLVTAASADLLTPYLTSWQGDVALGIPLVATLYEGKAVSICGSVRVTAQAHEAGVETHAEFRGRGFGARAVVSWANVVRRLGVTPLYSTSWDNVASRALAKHLGLTHFGSDFHAT
jgi:GNAT superfamily N-acetyltransferase